MEPRLWTVALILALLKTKWDIFHGKSEGDGMLGTQGFNATEIKLSTVPPPPHGDLMKFLFQWHPKKPTSTRNRWVHRGHSAGNRSSVQRNRVSLLPFRENV